MAERLRHLGVEVDDVPGAHLSQMNFDVGVWAAGYEERSAWLVRSEYRPQVARWYRVEFVEDRKALSAPLNLAFGATLGEVLGGRPGNRAWDGYWGPVWQGLFSSIANALQRRLRVFVDYSSMSRAVYGMALLKALRECKAYVEEVVFAYVPGSVYTGVHGSRAIEGVRALLGTEGISAAEGDCAFILGLGYDGIVAESIVDMYQASHVSVFYADPGVHPSSAERARAANASLIERAELVGSASIFTALETLRVIEQMRDWYAGLDVLLIPMGPKPLVLASLLAVFADPSIGFRLPQTGFLAPVDVQVPEGAMPILTRIRSTG